MTSGLGMRPAVAISPVGCLTGNRVVRSIGPALLPGLHAKGCPNLASVSMADGTIYNGAHQKDQARIGEDNESN